MITRRKSKEMRKGDDGISATDSNSSSPFSNPPSPTGGSPPSNGSSNATIKLPSRKTSPSDKNGTKAVPASLSPSSPLGSNLLGGFPLKTASLPASGNKKRARKSNEQEEDGYELTSNASVEVRDFGIGGRSVTDGFSPMTPIYSHYQDYPPTNKRTKSLAYTPQQSDYLDLTADEESTVTALMTLADVTSKQIGRHSHEEKDSWTVPYLRPPLSFPNHTLSIPGFSHLPELPDSHLEIRRPLRIRDIINDDSSHGVSPLINSGYQTNGPPLGHHQTFGASLPSFSNSIHHDNHEKLPNSATHLTIAKYILKNKTDSLTDPLSSPNSTYVKEFLFSLSNDGPAVDPKDAKIVRPEPITITDGLRFNQFLGGVYPPPMDAYPPSSLHPWSQQPNGAHSISFHPQPQAFHNQHGFPAQLAMQPLAHPHYMTMMPPQAQPSFSICPPLLPISDCHIPNRSLHRSSPGPEIRVRASDGALDDNNES